jgi:hypothetical protein
MATKKRAPGEFMRSWDTTVEVGKSRDALEALVRRYGATGFTVSEDYESRTVVVVFFLRPRPNEDPMEIRIPLSYGQVTDRLRRVPEFNQRLQRKPFSNRTPWMHDQAERVAWRLLVLWAEAMLSMVDAEMMALPEAFFAHAMIDVPGGHRLRAADAVAALKLLPGREDSR